MMTTVLWLALLCYSVVASPQQAAAQSAVKVHGSTTVNLTIFKPFKVQIETTAGVTLEVLANSSGHGLTDLVAGRADMAMLSSPLLAVAGKLNQKQPGAVDTSLLTEFQIGESKVAFIVHPSNAVKSLTLAQLQAIFTGKITNWQEVGGADVPIVVVTEAPGGGIRTTLEEKLLEGGAVAPNARAVPNAPQIPLIVKQLPGAIGSANARHDLAGVVTLHTEKDIAQPLVLVTKANPNAELTKVIDAATRVARQ